MNCIRWCICGALVVAGCSRSPEPAVAPQPAVASPSPAVPATGGGRFTFSAIRPTIGPADGSATELILAEAPITGEPSGPHVWIGLHGVSSSWSGKTVRLEGKDLARGWAGFSSAREREALPAVSVRFGMVTNGLPVEGEYDVTLPDGTKARGRFRAVWLPHPGAD